MAQEENKLPVAAGIPAPPPPKPPAAPPQEEPTDPNQPFGPTGPGIKKIEEWKEEHGEDEVFAIIIGGEVYIHRTITRSEYKNLKREVQEEVVPGIDPTALTEEKICRLCALWPDQNILETQMERRGGVATTLSDNIMETSGFHGMYNVPSVIKL